MLKFYFKATLFLSLLLPLPSNAYYNINLQNGAVLEAEDYKVEGKRMNLRFKVGSASFPLNMVKSVTDQSGRESTFSSTGEIIHNGPAEPAATGSHLPQETVQQPNVPPSAGIDPLTSPGMSDEVNPEQGAEPDSEAPPEDEPPLDEELLPSEGSTEVAQ